MAKMLTVPTKSLIGEYIGTLDVPVYEECGDYAITATTNASYSDLLYAITHVPTLYAMVKVRTMENAKSALYQLAELPNSAKLVDGKVVWDAEKKAEELPAIKQVVQKWHPWETNQ